MKRLSIFMAMCLSLASLGSPVVTEPIVGNGNVIEQQTVGSGILQEEDEAEAPDDFQGEAGDTDVIQGNEAEIGEGDGYQEDTAESPAEEDADSEGEADLDYVLGREMTEEEERQQRELFDLYASLSSYVEPEDMGENISLAGWNHIDQAWIPVAYDSRNVDGKCYITPIRDQNPYGTCWAFASVACIEANLVKNGYADLSLDLSERHAVYFSNHTVPDELGNGGNDISYYEGDVYMAGGNAIQVSRCMAAWKGAVEESFCPYGEIPQVPDTSLAAVYDNDFCHLTGFYRIEASDRNAVKEAIMEYGAVSASYYADNQYMNFDTGAYYCNGVTTTNHAVAIIGWDDSYKKENFKNVPTSNGAWLVKNSWGTRHANQGYFWLSYEDTSIYKTMYAFEVEPAKNDANNYQYDISTGGSGWLYSGTDFASVFTAKASADKWEKLTAVSVETGSEANVDYSLQIYKNPTDASNPTSGESMLSAPQTGHLKYVGYHVIPVNENVLLGPGDVFSVVLTLSKEGTRAVVLSEYDTPAPRFCDASAESGESFYSWNNGKSWRDIGETKDVNLRIKAFTETTAETYVKCTGVNISQSEVQIKEDDTLQLSAEILPQNASDKSCVWSSSDSNIVKVDQNGLVTAMNIGKAAVEVQTQNGGYKASCQITVIKGVEEPTLEITDCIGGKEVTFKSATPGAVIYYSDKSGITAEDKKVENGGKAKFESFNGTLYAKAYADGRWSRVTTKITFSISKVATPSISVKGNNVVINAPTGGSTLYYTTDGSVPTLTNGKKAAGTSVTIDTLSGTIKAIAVKSGYANSAMARKVLLNSNRSRNVSFAVKGVFGGRNVTFNSQTKGAKIYYSATTSTLTTKDKCVNAGETVLFENFYGTIYARTYYNGEWGNVCRLILKIPVVNTPTVKVDSKGYATIRTTTPNSRIYYTTNGSTPSMKNGKMVAAPYVRVYVGKGRTVKAIAVRSCFTHSKIGSGK